MRTRRGNWPIHPGEAGAEAQTDCDRAEDQSGPAEKWTLRNPSWKAAGPARVLAVYAEDFSLLIRFRRLTVKRGVVRVLS